MGRKKSNQTNNDFLSHLFPLLTGCGRMLSSNITLVTVISKVGLYGKAYRYSITFVLVTESGGSPLWNSMFINAP